MFHASTANTMIAHPLPNSNFPPTATPNQLACVQFEVARSGCCFDPYCSCWSFEIKLDGRIPLSLSNYLSQITWDDFCNQVNDVFLPYYKARLKASILMTISLLALVALIITQIGIYTGFVKLRTVTDDEWSYSMDPVSAIPIFIIVAFVQLFFIICISMCLTARVFTSSVLRINGICSDFSSRLPNLHIRLRNQDNPNNFLLVRPTSPYRDDDGVYHDAQYPAYIEFELSSSYSMAIDTTISYAPTLVTNTTGKSIAQRMADLESLRSVLSDQEYQQKRAEILSQI